MTQRWLLASTAITAAVSLAGLGTAAQAADAPTMIEELVVTAQKYEQRLQDVPSSVSAVGGETLQRAGSDELASVVKFVPGMHWENINVSKPMVFIRGFGTTAFDAGTDPSIAVFVDEVYIPRFTGMSTELLDVDRVEVLKGPQGTLYGRNAAGGAINLITRSPVSANEGEFRVGASSRDTISGSGTVSGALTDSISGRLSFSAKNGDGYMDAPGSANDGFNSNRAYVRGKLLFDLGGDTRFLLNADYGRVRESMWAMSNGGQRIAQKHPSVLVNYTPDRFSEPYDFPGFQNSWGGGISGKLSTTLPIGELTSVSAYRHSKLDEFTDFDASSADSVRRRFGESSRSLQQEIRLAAEPLENVKLIAGVFLFHETVDRFGEFYLGRDNQFVIGIGPFPGNGGRPFSNLDTRRIETDSYAFFGQANIAVTDQFNVSLGGRFSEDRKKMDRRAVTVGASPAANPFSQPFAVDVKKSWNSFDPSVSLDYHVNDDVMIYGSWKKGYKSGGFQTDPVINATAASVVFGPERVTSFEAGLKGAWFDRRLQGSVAAFRNDYDDLQGLRTVPLGGGAFASLIDNVAKAKAKGVELEFVAAPTDNLRIQAGYGYLDSHYGTFVTPTGVVLTGAQTSRSPKHTLNAGATVNIPVGEGQVVLEANARYSSSFMFEASNPALYAREKGHTTADAFIHWDSGDERWRLSLWAKNLTNERYRTHNIVIIVSPTPLTVTSLDTYAPPRTVGVDLTWRFGR